MILRVNFKENKDTSRTAQKFDVSSHQLILSYSYVLDFSPARRYRIQSPGRFPAVNFQNIVTTGE